MTWLVSSKKYLARRAASAAKVSERLVDNLPGWIQRAIPWWITSWMLLAGWKIIMADSLIRNVADFAGLFIPYAMIGLAPLAAFRLAEHAYPPDYRGIEPRFRISLGGRWRNLEWDEASRHPLFGPSGFMASLLVGLLLNVVFRSGEFLLAVPAMTAASPAWGRTLFLVMALDVVVMNFLYVACCMMALRTAPMFPRIMVITWMIDIGMQFTIAGAVNAQGSVPVAVSDALLTLLGSNIDKVAISVLIWLPYLLLSRRVNVTYRRRLALWK